MQLNPQATLVLGWTGVSLLRTWSAYIFWQTSTSVFYLPAPVWKLSAPLVHLAARVAVLLREVSKGRPSQGAGKVIQGYSNSAAKSWHTLMCLWQSVYFFKLNNLFLRFSGFLFSFFFPLFFFFFKKQNKEIQKITLQRNQTKLQWKITLT